MGGRVLQKLVFEISMNGTFFRRHRTTKTHDFCLPLVWNPTVLDSAAHSKTPEIIERMPLRLGPSKSVKKRAAAIYAAQGDNITMD